MGKMKELFYDEINRQRDHRLAKKLGITTHELDEISYTIDSEISRDGFIFGYVVNFDEDNDPEIMKKIKGLTSNSYVCLDLWDLDDLEQIELEWEVEYTEQLETFNKNLEAVPRILTINPENDIGFSLLVMLHAHIVSAFEHYLSSIFISQVTNSDVLTRKLIETDPEFRNRKFTMNEIYIQHDAIKKTVAAYLKNIIFHDIQKIKPMFLEVLSYDFKDIAWLFRSILIRHDCVHRAGYDKKGEQVPITSESITELMLNCKNLAKDIDTHISRMK